MAFEANEPTAHIRLADEPREAVHGSFSNGYGYGYGERVDLRHYWRIDRKHLWLVASVPLTMIVLAGVHDLMATSLYAAQATILIKSNAPEVYAYTAVDSPGQSDNASSQWKVDGKTEYTLLRAQSLANRVFLTEGLIANPFLPALGRPPALPAKMS